MNTPRRRAPAPGRNGAAAELLAGIAWTPPFLALLYYLAAVITFRLPGAAVAAASCLIFLALRPDQLRFSTPLWFILAFVVWAGVTVVASEFRAEAFEAWISMAKLFLISVMAYNAIRSREQLRFTMLFSAFCFLLFPFRGAVFNYLFGYSVFGRAIWNYVYANPNDMAAFSLLAASVAAAAGSMYRHKVLRVVLFTTALACCVLVFLTQSRGAIVGMGLAGAIAFIGTRQKAQFVGIAVAIAIAAVLFAPTAVWNRLSGLAKISAAEGMKGVDAERSAEQRFQLAKVAVAVIGTSPVLGVGIGAYPEAHAIQAFQMKTELPIAGGRRDAHNTVLRVAAETGIPGVSLFLSILLSTVVIYRRGIRQERNETNRASARWTILGLTAFCFAGLFGSFAYVNLLYLQLTFISLLVVVRPSAARAPSYSHRVTGHALQTPTIRRNT